MRRLRAFLLTALVLVALGIALTLAIQAWMRGEGLTDAEAQTIVVDTLLRDRPEAFVVTGTLEFSTDLEQRSRKVLLPGVLDLDLGTTVVRVRAPARAAYGFDANTLQTEAIRVRGDTLVLPAPLLTVFAVEPDLTAMEMQTDTGWARMQSRSGNAQERAALRQLLPAMRDRAARYLLDAEPPRANTLVAIERILVPAFEAAGWRPVMVFEDVAGPSGTDAEPGPPRQIFD
ncbi:MAG: DUF4230 domain-containing protein [Bacteroidota bacterium]